METMSNYIEIATYDRSNGIEAASVDELLKHIAKQTKNIDDKLTQMIDQHVAKDLQNYYNKVNQTLSEINRKTV